MAPLMMKIRHTPGKPVTAKRVFLSFHYGPDHSRADLVRNMGVIEGNPPAREGEWETITHDGDIAIQKWISQQVSGRACTVVLIGQETAGRKWIHYEIEKSWNEGKGLVGVHIHNLKDASGHQSQKGANPFAEFTMKKDGVTPLASIVKTYDPPYSMSTMAYLYIKTHLAAWVEEAITIRRQYKG